MNIPQNSTYKNSGTEKQIPVIATRPNPSLASFASKGSPFDPQPLPMEGTPEYWKMIDDLLISLQKKENLSNQGENTPSVIKPRTSEIDPDYDKTLPPGTVFRNLSSSLGGGQYEMDPSNPTGRVLYNVPQTNQNLYKVVNVIDGDTIDVDINGQTERVRVKGINTPETKNPVKPVQLFGLNATEKAKDFLTNQYVSLELDPNDPRDRDDYGRLLRYVFVGKENISNQMIQSGYAPKERSLPSYQFTRENIKEELGDRPSWLFNVSYKIPVWANGSESKENVEVLPISSSKKKAKVQAIAHTLLTSGDINYNEARNIAILWKDKEVEDVPDADENGFISPEVAKEVYSSWSKIPKTTIKSVLAALPDAAKNIGKGWMPEGLRTFVKSFSTGATTGFIPYERDDEDFSTFDKILEFAGFTAGGLVGFMGFGAGLKGIQIGGKVLGKMGLHALKKRTTAGLLKAGFQNPGTLKGVASKGGLNRLFEPITAKGRALAASSKPVEVAGSVNKALGSFTYGRAAKTVGQFLGYGEFARQIESKYNPAVLSGQEPERVVEDRVGGMVKDLAMGIALGTAGPSLRGVAQSALGPMIVEFMSNPKDPVGALSTGLIFGALHGIGVPAGKANLKQRLALQEKAVNEHIVNEFRKYDPNFVPNWKPGEKLDPKEIEDMVFKAKNTVIGLRDLSKAPRPTKEGEPFMEKPEGAPAEQMVLSKFEPLKKPTTLSEYNSELKRIIAMGRQLYKNTLPELQKRKANVDDLFSWTKRLQQKRAEGLTTDFSVPPTAQKMAELIEKDREMFFKPLPDTPPVEGNKTGYTVISGLNADPNILIATEFLSQKAAKNAPAFGTFHLRPEIGGFLKSLYEFKKPSEIKELIDPTPENALQAIGYPKNPRTNKIEAYDIGFGASNERLNDPKIGYNSQPGVKEGGLYVANLDNNILAAEMKKRGITVLPFEIVKAQEETAMSKKAAKEGEKGKAFMLARITDAHWDLAEKLKAELATAEKIMPVEYQIEKAKTQDAFSRQETIKNIVEQNTEPASTLLPTLPPEAPPDVKIEREGSGKVLTKLEDALSETTPEGVQMRLFENFGIKVDKPKAEELAQKNVTVKEGLDLVNEAIASGNIDKSAEFEARLAANDFESSDFKASDEALFLDKVKIPKKETVTPPVAQEGEFQNVMKNASEPPVELAPKTEPVVESKTSAVESKTPVVESKTPTAEDILKETKAKEDKINEDFSKDLITGEDRYDQVTNLWQEAQKRIREIGKEGPLTKAPVKEYRPGVSYEKTEQGYLIEQDPNSGTFWANATKKGADIKWVLEEEPIKNKKIDWTTKKGVMVDGKFFANNPDASKFIQEKYLSKKDSLFKQSLAVKELYNRSKVVLEEESYPAKGVYNPKETDTSFIEETTLPKDRDWFTPIEQLAKNELMAEKNISPSPEKIKDLATKYDVALNDAKYFARKVINKTNKLDPLSRLLKQRGLFGAQVKKEVQDMLSSDLVWKIATEGDIPFNHARAAVDTVRFVRYDESGDIIRQTKKTQEVLPEEDLAIPRIKGGKEFVSWIQNRKSLKPGTYEHSLLWTLDKLFTSKFGKGYETKDDYLQLIGRVFGTQDEAAIKFKKFASNIDPRGSGGEISDDLSYFLARAETNRKKTEQAKEAREEEIGEEQENRFLSMSRDKTSRSEDFKDFESTKDNTSDFESGAGNSVVEQKALEAGLRFSSPGQNRVEGLTRQDKELFPGLTAIMSLGQSNEGPQAIAFAAGDARNIFQFFLSENNKAAEISRKQKVKNQVLKRKFIIPPEGKKYANLTKASDKVIENLIKKYNIEEDQEYLKLKNQLDSIQKAILDKTERSSWETPEILNEQLEDVKAMLAKYKNLNITSTDGGGGPGIHDGRGGIGDMWSNLKQTINTTKDYYLKGPPTYTSERALNTEPSYSFRGLKATDKDLDEAANILYGEISNRSPERQQFEIKHIINTVVNRAQNNPNQFGKTFLEVLQKPYQYQGYAPEGITVKGGKTIESQYQRARDKKLNEMEQKRYQRIRDVLNEIKSGNFEDTTGGAMYYVHASDGTLWLGRTLEEAKKNANNHEKALKNTVTKWGTAVGLPAKITYNN